MDSSDVTKKKLARFYAAITGWSETTPHDDYPEWVQLAGDGGATIAFQQVEGFRAPQWPGQEHPQQLHLDFTVPDLDAGERVGDLTCWGQPRRSRGPSMAR